MPTQKEPETLSIVATTPLIADMVENIAGDRAVVTSLIPLGADPHTFEPGLKAVRDTAHADAVFTNGLLLEQQSLTRTIAHTASPNTPVVALAEQLPRYGGALLPLVEDNTLDTVWLGLRVIADSGRTDVASGRMRINAQAADTPPGAALVAYTTSTFGAPEVVVDSRDSAQHTDIPLDAHTHLSWAATAPGYYSMTFAAAAGESAGVVASGGAPQRQYVPVASGTVNFAVGVDPYGHPAVSGTTPHVADAGHLDITVDEGQHTITLVGDPEAPHAPRPVFDPAQAVISVPAKTLTPIPPGPEYRFLYTQNNPQEAAEPHPQPAATGWRAWLSKLTGNRGQQQVYMLRQAVVGKHVHGDTDPHAWLDANNGEAYAQAIAATLSDIDPDNAAYYQSRLSRYRAQIQAADASLFAAVASVDPARRNMVTTHDGYGYLAERYGLKVAGVISPNAETEPSPRDVAAVSSALRDLKVPAVFIEPQATAHHATLIRIAADNEVATCPIFGDTLSPDDGVNSYLDVLTADAESIRSCLISPPQTIHDNTSND
ncbi:hypothetical protein CAQU_06625 [Corynebacterium aquilae DSM 44791]|uniref:Anchored repeat ABC transporter, substrate-binding protein n=1 Tax=Corynebacterium aquilae DSM 44791 TaxID=1431546 RepID=A0A1L7CFZ6_9CORY|nr:hypothetical protein CAQU_06625 [Corynebacterium aquilae DSM 44791]